jgi:hypothetical protein
MIGGCAATPMMHPDGWSNEWSEPMAIGGVVSNCSDHLLRLSVPLRDECVQRIGAWVKVASMGTAPSMAVVGWLEW